MSDVQEETSLKQMIQNMCPEGPSVIEGTVTSASPLKITLTNDSKMVLTANSLIVPRHLTNYKTSISGGNIQNYYYVGSGENASTVPVSPSHVHAIGKVSVTVYDALQTGDTVYLLAFNNGKQYYVLDRKG